MDATATLVSCNTAKLLPPAMTTPSSRAAVPTLCPDVTRLTASSLNSTVNSCFGNLKLPFSCLVIALALLEDEISGEVHVLQRHDVDTEVAERVLHFRDAG